LPILPPHDPAYPVFPLLQNFGVYKIIFQNIAEKEILSDKERKRSL
jgi:hypothetical protein